MSPSASIAKEMTNGYSRPLLTGVQVFPSSVDRKTPPYVPANRCPAELIASARTFVAVSPLLTGVHVSSVVGGTEDAASLSSYEDVAARVGRQCDHVAALRAVGLHPKVVRARLPLRGARARLRAGCGEPGRRIERPVDQSGLAGGFGESAAAERIGTRSASSATVRMAVTRRPWRCGTCPRQAFTMTTPFFGRGRCPKPGGQGTGSRTLSSPSANEVKLANLRPALCQGLRPAVEEHAQAPCVGSALDPEVRR